MAEPSRVTEVVVPDEFQAIGFSGLFHAETTLEGGPKVIEEWAAKAPCLLRGDKWMLLIARLVLAW